MVDVVNLFLVQGENLLSSSLVVGSLGGPGQLPDIYSTRHGRVSKVESGQYFFSTSIFEYKMLKLKTD